ncbi:MAG: hypothetical protein ACI9B9_000985 [Halioglobus sp.]|jgi:hypothetical protein
MEYLLPTIITPSSACMTHPCLATADVHCGNGFFDTEADIKSSYHHIKNNREENEIST